MRRVLLFVILAAFIGGGPAFAGSPRQIYQRDGTPFGRNEPDRVGAPQQ